jgi:hypothetical protein
VPAATPGGGGRRGGIALDMRRGKTAKKRLEIEWHHPVWKPPAPAEGEPRGGTVVVARERALPKAEAYELAAGDDRRPLLVVRECDRCRGSDHALLSRTLDNEQTVLLTHWFRCVKLPTNVMEPDHPLSALFRGVKPGERVPHLFFSDPDGQNRIDLPGDQTQSALWETMFAILERCYEGNAKQRVKEMRGLLSQFDRIDSREEDLLARLDAELDKNGPDSPKAKKLEADLEKLGKERKELLLREKELRALALRELAEPAATDKPGEAQPGGAQPGRDPGK